MEGDGVGVVAPVGEVFRELLGVLVTGDSVRLLGTKIGKRTYHPLPLPIDVDIVYLWVQACVDVVGLVAREDDVSSVAALVEGF